MTLQDLCSRLRLSQPSPVPYVQDGKGRSRCCWCLDARTGAQVLSVTLITLVSILSLGILAYDVFDLIRQSQVSGYWTGYNSASQFHPADNLPPHHSLLPPGGGSAAPPSSSPTSDAGCDCQHRSNINTALIVPDFIAELVATLFMAVTFLLPNILLLKGLRTKNSDYLVPWLFITFLCLVGMLCLAVISLAYTVSGLVVWEFWIVISLLLVGLTVLFAYFWVVVRDVFYSMKRENSGENLVMNVTEVHRSSFSEMSSTA